jgi:hypothetical protein
VPVELTRRPIVNHIARGEAVYDPFLGSGTTDLRSDRERSRTSKGERTLMAMRGRPPKPTALKVIEGNLGKRPLNDREPRLEVKEPEIPGHLDEVARTEWKRITPILVQMRVLTEAEQVMLGCLCQTYSTLIDAQAKLKIAGLLYQTPSGYVQ